MLACLLCLPACPACLPACRLVLSSVWSFVFCSFVVLFGRLCRRLSSGLGLRSGRCWILGLARVPRRIPLFPRPAMVDARRRVARWRSASPSEGAAGGRLGLFVAGRLGWPSWLLAVLWLTVAVLGGGVMCWCCAAISSRTLRAVEAFQMSCMGLGNRTVAAC